jgi:hypothetical protein
MALDESAFGVNPEYRPVRRRGPLRFLTFPFRFLFRLFKRTIAGLIRALAFHPVGSLVFLLLVGSVGFLGYNDYTGGKGLHLGGTTSQITDGNMPPSPAAENFIKGQTSYDAGLMWSSFNDSLKQQLSSRGTNQQSLQRQLDQRKQSGTKVDHVDYVGGVQTADGSRLFVYVLTIEAPGSQGVAENHYVLTVDQSDKISKVE